MGRIPQCNLHPDRFMFQTAVRVQNPNGEAECFEAYRCVQSGCTRHYALKKGYFDIIGPDSTFVQDGSAKAHFCPTDREVLVVNRLNMGYVYRCPVEDCDYAEPYGIKEPPPVPRPSGRDSHRRGGPHTNSVRR